MAVQLYWDYQNGTIYGAMNEETANAARAAGLISWGQWEPGGLEYVPISSPNEILGAITQSPTAWANSLGGGAAAPVPARYATQTPVATIPTSTALGSQAATTGASMLPFDQQLLDILGQGQYSALGGVLPNQPTAGPQAGDTETVDGVTYVYLYGQWVPLPGSRTIGIAPTSTGGTGPKEGDTQTDSGITYRYTGGQWVTQTNNLGGTNMANAWPTGEFAASFPQAAWANAFGLPAYGQNPYQKWQYGQAAPAYASWLGGQLLPGASPAEFNPGGGYGGGSALATLQAARGMGAPEQVQWGSEIGGNDALSNLLQSALGSGGRGYASPIANIMANRVGGLQQGWNQQTQAGAMGPTFLEYLMQKYGL